MPRKSHKEEGQRSVRRRVVGKPVVPVEVAAIPEPVSGVAVGSLMRGIMFEYEGKLYRKVTMPNSPFFKARYTDILNPERQVEFDPATLVVPKK